MRTIIYLTLAVLCIRAQAQEVTAPPPNILPMVKAQWHQKAPFNLLCPAHEEDGQTVHDVAGCGAVAMAQIMHFHRYPETSPDGETRYDWDRMFQRLSNETTTDRMANVAKLISDCGVAVFTRYGKESSSSKTLQTITAMKGFFHYNKYMYCVSRDQLKARGCDDEFRQLLFAELKAGRPVIYRGTKTTSNNDDNGHIFIIDGCKNGKVHANMGWADKANDYYDLDDLNGYSHHHWMIVGIADSSYQPPIKEIRTDVPGTLESRLDTTDLHLRIAGPVNDTDIAALRQLALDKERLRSIDLSGATLLGNLPDRAFAECGSLVYVALPPSVTYIGRMAFYKCSALNRIDLPEALGAIGEAAFHSCHQLTTFHLPGTLRWIGPRAFMFCNSLTSVRIPEGVEYIDWIAFGGAARLKFLHLPKSLKRLAPEITQSCPALMQVTVPEENPWLTSEGLRVIPKGADVDKNDVRHIRLEHAGTLAGQLSPSDWKIRITDPVNEADIAALRNMARNESELRDIDLRGTDLKVMPRSAFANCKKIRNVFLPEGLERIEDFAFTQCKWLERIDIPSTVTSIRTYVFNGCSALKTVNFNPTGSRLRFIGSNAFSNCTALTDIHLPENVDTLEGGIFRNCVNLHTLHFPKNLKMAGGGITTGCGKLQNVTLSPDNLLYKVENKQLRSRKTEP